MPFTTADLDELRFRHVAAYRGIGEMAAGLARTVAAPFLSPDDDGDDGNDPSPAASPRETFLAFERLVRIAHLAMTAERDIVTDALADDAAKPTAKPAAKPVAEPLRLTASDPVRNMIREPLHAATRAEPDRATRERLRKAMDARVDAERAERPDAKPVEILEAVAAEFAVTLDYKNFSDELLGMPPRVYPDAPPGWVPPVNPRLRRFR